MACVCKVVVASFGGSETESAVEAMVATLQDAGAEVVLAGVALTAEELVSVAIQEDADSVVIVLPDANDLPECRRFLAHLRGERADRVTVVVSGPLAAESLATLGEDSAGPAVSFGVTPDTVAEFLVSEKSRGR